MSILPLKQNYEDIIDRKIFWH